MASGIPDEEVVPPSETTAIRTLVVALERRVLEGARTGPARRDAHPKAHGTLAAEFRVLEGLPTAVRHGILAAPRAYEAWIRFSSGSPRPQPDGVGDVRGMAIKLLGVEGSPSGTQDILLISHPVLFLRDAAEAVAFQATAPPWRFFFPGLNPLGFRLRAFLLARAMRGNRAGNPLDIRYWSAVPFRLGPAACKFSARPAGPASPFTLAGGPDFLRANLAAHLAESGAAFDFMVQLRTRPETMPVEDPRIEWREADAPFIPVARITIPPQRFATPERDAFGEALSFTPWHGLEAHRPLGGINRARRAAYEAVSALRHRLNGTERREPGPPPQQAATVPGIAADASP